MKRVIKPILGVGLLGLVLSQLDVLRLVELSRGIQWPWFLAALLFSTLNAIISARRWGRIASDLGIVIPPAFALRTYFQGITANTVLPGGIVGGDVWRIGVLVSRGALKTTAALTVLLDRASGFWLLGVLSVVGVTVGLLTGKQDALGTIAWIYIGLLFVIVIAPGVLHYLKPVYVSVLLRTAGLSLLVQICSVAALWCSLAAVGVFISVWALMALATFIFLAAIVPAAVGGFGSREVGAVIALGYLGVASEPSFLASVLFGLTATLQGIAGSYFWITPSKPDRQ